MSTSAATAAPVHALNPLARVSVLQLASGCPVLQIDDFYADPHAVRAQALAGRYDGSVAYYPGLHAQLADDDRHQMLGAVARILAALNSVRCTPQDMTTDYSIVTTPASEMLAMQKHPHVDDVPLAGVVYLNPDYAVGTSFFRHRPTGLAFVRDAEERRRYHAWLAAEGERTQPSTYAVGDADEGPWEHLYSTEGRFNRLVLYPGTAFHSIAMQDIGRNLRMDSARLTQRIFIHRAGHA